MFKLLNADYSFICCKAGRLAGGSDLNFCACMFAFGDRKGGSFGHGCSRRMVPTSNPNIFTPTPQLAPTQYPTHHPPGLSSINPASSSPNKGPCKPPGDGFDTENSHPLLGTRPFPRADGSRGRGRCALSYNRFDGHL
ncbi:hypothetical protein N431DRAFT_89726 [Stipitochalara longipes BDJ]|nr:hypothetical protein N431DRAFT_89726 [Stipitochalara longipes BDJ]